MGDIISLDSTIFIQAINFIVTLVVLNYLLIKPVREQVSSRNAIMSTFTGEINTFNDSANEKLKTYESALDEARTSATKAREAVRNDATAEEQKILAQAHTDAQSFLTQSRTKVMAESKIATKDLLAQVDKFANLAVEKILS